MVDPHIYRGLGYKVVAKLRVFSAWLLPAVLALVPLAVAVKRPGQVVAAAAAGAAALGVLAALVQVLASAALIRPYESLGDHS